LSLLLLLLSRSPHSNGSHRVLDEPVSRHLLVLIDDVEIRVEKKESVDELMDDVWKNEIHDRKSQEWFRDERRKIERGESDEPEEP